MRLSELTSQQRHASENLLGQAALCIYESRVKKMSIEELAAMRFPNSKPALTIAKAAQSPALSSEPGYAQELTLQAYGELIDLLRARAILPSVVPLAQQHTFNGASSIYLPQRTGSSTAAAGAFRGEASPITVRGMMFTHQLLTPKNMAVILTATGEMFHRSSMDLAAYFQNEIVKDTATALDQHFVSAAPASAIAPAGARAGLTAADTRASTGATADAIVNDLGVMLGALADANMGGPSTRWLMHPKNWFKLSLLQSATGAREFPEAASGQLAGIPVVQSTTMPVDAILLIDFEHYTFALGNPALEPTTMATIHEEDETPLPIATPGAPNVMAAPVRSLYQTYSMAVRAVFDVDYLRLREHAVQELVSVAW